MALKRVQTRQTGQQLITQYFTETYNPHGLPQDPPEAPSEAQPPDDASISIDGDSQMDTAEMLQAYFAAFDARIQNEIADADIDGPSSAPTEAEF